MKLSIFLLTLLTIVCPTFGMEDENRPTAYEDDPELAAALALSNQTPSKLAENRRIREEQRREFAKSLRKDQERENLLEKGDETVLKGAKGKEEEDVDLDTVRQARLKRLALKNNDQGTGKNYFNLLPKEIMVHLLGYALPNYYALLRLNKDFNQFCHKHFDQFGNKTVQSLLLNKAIRFIKQNDEEDEKYKRGGGYNGKVTATKYNIPMILSACLTEPYPSYYTDKPIARFTLFSPHFSTNLKEDLYCGQGGDHLDDHFVSNDTVLMYATQNNALAVMQLLLDKGADPDRQTFGHRHGETALILAAQNNLPEAVLLLLKNGANIEARNSSGSTALMYAAKYNSLQAATALLAHGANVNAQCHYHERHCCRRATDQSQCKGHGNRDTALIRAAKTDSLAVAKLLLEHGADINAQDKIGKSALDYAQSDAMRKLLLNPPKKQLQQKRLAYFEKQQGDNNNNAIKADQKDYFSQLPDETIIHIMQYAFANYPALRRANKRFLQLTNDKEVQTYAYSSDTMHKLLSNACKHDMDKVITQHLKDVPNFVNYADSPISAAKHNALRVVKLLLAKGAQVNATGSLNIERERTPLMEAAKYGHLHMVRLLLKNKARVNTRDADGLTALMYAIQFDRSDVAQTLLKHGANPSIIDCYRRTAFDFARTEEMKQLLKQYGAQ